MLAMQKRSCTMFIMNKLSLKQRAQILHLLVDAKRCRRVMPLTKAIFAALLGYASLTQPTKTCYPTAFGYFRH